MIALIILLLTVAFWFAKPRKSFWVAQGISGPKAWPIVGNALSQMFRSSAQLDQENFAKYGHVYGYYDGRRPVLMVSDPKIIQQVFVSQFTDFQGSLVETLGGHVVERNLVDGMIGHRWKRVRSVLASSFKMRPVADSIQKAVDTLVQSLEKTVLSDNSEISIKTVITPHVLDATCRSFFSLNMNFYESEYMLRNYAAMFFNTVTVPQSLYFSKVIKSPWNVFGVGSKIEHGANYIGSFVKQVVETRYQSEMHGKDILQYLLDVKGKENNMSQSQLNETEIICNTASFIATSDSTANGLCLLLWRLAIHPEVQDELVKEITDVCGNAEYDIVYDDMNKLVYLEAVLREALRMNPVSVRLMRVCTANTVIGDDIQIPSGTAIMVPVTVVHSDPNNFEDPEHFRPERFLAGNKHELKHCSFLGFGAGPRICLGMRFAIMNIKQTAVQLLRRYRVVKCATTLEAVNFDFVNGSEICIKLIRR
ncbi:Cytochrome P450 3A24 [Halotydeus destructor]|nr:Cytochrome P450 3A24 [Halotydeus destructor]